MDLQKRTFIDCGMFEGLDDSALDKCIEGIALHTFRKDDVLIEKNKQSEGLFIIHTGLVGIYTEDVLLTQFGPTSIIGESFIGNTPATASSIAIEDTTAYVIFKDQLFHIIKTYPRVIQNLFSQVVNRLRTSNDTTLTEAHNRAEKLEKLVDERTAELQVTLSELKYTQQFRDRFLANMSHEIRTPMNAIVGLTNLLVHTPVNDQQKKYLQVIKKSGENLIVIINDILDLSKIEAGKMELEKVVFSLHQAVENVVAILEIRAKEKGIVIEPAIDKDVPEYVISDETRLSQILINIAGNAIKFTSNGVVRIQLGVEETHQDHVKICFKIVDSGIGIPEDKLDKIFESFGQASADTSRKYGGTGLGLNISRQLVELYGGQLQVKSVVDKGSTFYFTIPMQIASGPELVLIDGHAENEVLSQLSILLVEDNLFNQMVAQDTLEALFPGCIIDLAVDGKTAIAKASSNIYNLILMDIRLPDIDGFEITRFIRSELEYPMQNVPICAMTASISKERIDECYNAGMNDYMYKPFNQEALKQKVTSNARDLKGISRYDRIKQAIIQRLKRELSPHLTYHSVEHTLEVLGAIEVIGGSENVSVKDMELLKVAVLFHDMGYLVNSVEHELSSCHFAEQILPIFQYTTEEIQVVRQLILATQSTHLPTNKLEEIICDADLDYLGRDDYYQVAEKLRIELEHSSKPINPDLWNEMQIEFLEKHKYFTNTSQQMRNAKKKAHLNELQDKRNLLPK